MKKINCNEFKVEKHNLLELIKILDRSGRRCQRGKDAPYMCTSISKTYPN